MPAKPKRFAKLLVRHLSKGEPLVRWSSGLKCWGINTNSPRLQSTDPPCIPSGGQGPWFVLLQRMINHFWRNNNRNHCHRVIDHDRPDLSPALFTVIRGWGRQGTNGYSSPLSRPRRLRLAVSESPPVISSNVISSSYARSVQKGSNINISKKKECFKPHQSQPLRTLSL